MCVCVCVCVCIYMYIHVYASDQAHAFGSSRVEFKGGGGELSAEVWGEEGR